MEDKFDKKIKKMNKEITRILWIAFLSMITAIITTLAATG